MDLGCSVCGLGGVGTANYFHSRNPDPDPARRCIDDPYTTAILWPNYHSGANGDYQQIQTTSPHPLVIDGKKPGGVIQPHTDAGNWAPLHFNCKAHVTLYGSSVSQCEEEQVIMRQGDVFTFDNLLSHSVTNNGDCDRICCIVSMRAD
jgi:hypothetical protein